MGKKKKSIWRCAIIRIFVFVNILLYLHKIIEDCANYCG